MMPHEPHLASALEPGQLTAAKRTRLPRRKLGPGTKFLLYALRMYVLLAIPVVIYAFIHALGTSK